MKLSFTKRDKIIMAAFVFLLILIIVFAQFFYLNPLKTDLAMKQLSLQSEQKLLDTLSKNKADTAAKSAAVDTRELQKRIPVKPLEDELILDLEKAETVSNSQIQSMSFTTGGDVAAAASQPAAANTQGQQNTTNQSVTQNAGSTTQNSVNTNQNSANTNQNTAGNTYQPTANQQASAANSQAQTANPTGLKKLTVSLSVQSPNYQQFEKFIATLESLKRIVVVEQINYSGGQEVTSQTTPQSQPLSYTLTVSAFYMPSLADLQSQVPAIDAPAPAGKTNPLVQYPVVTNQ